MAFLQKMIKSIVDHTRGGETRERKVIHVNRSKEVIVSESDRVTSSIRTKGGGSREKEREDEGERDRISIDFSIFGANSKSATPKTTNHNTRDLYETIQFEDINVDISSSNSSNSGDTSSRKRKSMPPKAKKVSSTRTCENIHPNSFFHSDASADNNRGEDNVKIKSKSSFANVDSSSNYVGSKANNDKEEKDTRFESSRPLAAKRSFTRPALSNLVVLGLHDKPPVPTEELSVAANPFLTNYTANTSKGTQNPSTLDTNPTDYIHSNDSDYYSSYDSNYYQNSTYDNATYEGTYDSTSYYDGTYDEQSTYVEAHGDSNYYNDSQSQYYISTGSTGDDDESVAYTSQPTSRSRVTFQDPVVETAGVETSTSRRHEDSKTYNYNNRPKIAPSSELIEKAFSKIRHQRLNDFKELITSGKVDIGSVDDKGNNFLHICGQNNSKKIAAFIIKNGCSKNLLNFKGLTPLDYAVMYQFYELAAFLKENQCYSSNQIKFKSPKAPIRVYGEYNEEENRSRQREGSFRDQGDDWEGEIIE